MKFTLSWLKNHIDTDADIDTIGARLTMLGLEVEDIADRAKDLAPFTVAYVKEAKPHPNADKLRVCIVETAHGTHQVVCGAPNARTGMKGVFAPVGSHIPGTNLDLKKGTIRGVDSNGMLVSMREMGLSDEHDGIIELADDAPVGEPFARLLGLDDPVIDINVTADRPDCLGVHGVARDLAAAGIGKLRAPDLSAVPGAFDSPVKWLRDLPADQQHLCPYVVGRYFRGVKNGPSPKWLQDKLLAIGLRPISALVDITNYVTFDLGRPLHVFDAKRSSAISPCDWQSPANPSRRSTARPTNSTTAWWSSPTRPAPTASAASWAVRRPAASSTPPRSSWRWRCSIPSAPRPAAASWASSPTPASASSAASIPRAPTGAPRWRRG